MPSMPNFNDRLFDLFMPMLPKNDLSHFVGRLVHKRLPGALGRKSVEAFAKAYRIDLSEAELPIEAYPSIVELFTLKLKPEARPTADTRVVHCADALITEAGTIEHQMLIQAKGKHYNVSELLRSSKFAEDFEGGSFFTYYLCPTDYHRVHSPVSGEIIWSCHIPGELWPVNAWSVKSIPSLFAINERVVVMIQTPFGKAALVMVAATNVGNMSMSFDDQISTRVRRGQRKVREHTYQPPVPIRAGSEVGIFHMGSTVVMLFEKGMVERAAAWKMKRTLVGAALSSV